MQIAPLRGRALALLAAPPVALLCAAPALWAAERGTAFDIVSLDARTAWVYALGVGFVYVALAYIMAALLGWTAWRATAFAHSFAARVSAASVLGALCGLALLHAITTWGLTRNEQALVFLTGWTFLVALYPVYRRLERTAS